MLTFHNGEHVLRVDGHRLQGNGEGAQLSPVAEQTPAVQLTVQQPATQLAVDMRASNPTAELHACQHLSEPAGGFFGGPADAAVANGVGAAAGAGDHVLAATQKVADNPPATPIVVSLLCTPSGIVHPLCYQLPSGSRLQLSRSVHDSIGTACFCFCLPCSLRFAFHTSRGQHVAPL